METGLCVSCALIVTLFEPKDECNPDVIVVLRAADEGLSPGFGVHTVTRDVWPCRPAVEQWVALLLCAIFRSYFACFINLGRDLIHKRAGNL